MLERRSESPAGISGRSVFIRLNPVRHTGPLDRLRSTTRTLQVPDLTGGSEVQVPVTAPAAKVDLRWTKI
jgi:hypothetical protein